MRILSLTDESHLLEICQRRIPAPQGFSPRSTLSFAYPQALQTTLTTLWTLRGDKKPDRRCKIMYDESYGVRVFNRASGNRAVRLRLARTRYLVSSPVFPLLVLHRSLRLFVHAFPAAFAFCSSVLSSIHLMKIWLENVALQWNVNSLDISLRVVSRRHGTPRLVNTADSLYWAL